MRKQEVTIKTAGRAAIVVTVTHEDPAKCSPKVNLMSHLPDDETNFALALAVGLLAEIMLKASGQRPEAHVTIDVGDTGALVSAVQAERLRRAGN